MLEKYPYNEDFEAWEVKTKLLDEEITVLTQARDEMEFIKRTVELHERIKWLNDKGQDICDLLSSNEKDLTVDGESRIELRPAEIAVLRCYAEMTDDGIALDLIVGIVATGIEKEVSMFVDEFDNMEVLGEIKGEDE
ncbi:MAG: hypothetical protein IJL60_03155 [Clostridiales bacterium]|nr:hypothetical protein [Clostridiales bacterium]MBQ6270594.1 hypothetical protein [Clostridiales bacterium]MBR4010054.1 hypothetical protein [Clostridiales bacterium]MBR6253824.1 hypothetical protein [Clostridiales bacterium]